jgi:hypothetical protein
MARNKTGFSIFMTKSLLLCWLAPGILLTFLLPNPRIPDIGIYQSGADKTIGKKTNKLLKLKEREIEALKKENATVTEKLIHFQTDSKVNKEANNKKNRLKKDARKNLKPSSVPVHYECDEKYESLCKLKSHIRTIHVKTLCTQTEETTV